MVAVADFEYRWAERLAEWSGSRSDIVTGETLPHHSLLCRCD
jgi:hypothetical protein